MGIRNLFVILPLLSFLILSCKNTLKENFSGEKKLTIQTKGIEYDSLFIRDWDIVSVRNKHKFLIRGEKFDSITWKFRIPDSLYNTVASFELLTRLFDPVSNTASGTRFVTNTDNGELYTNQLTFDDNYPSITIQFRKCVISENIPLNIITPEGKDTSVTGTYNQTEFVVRPPENSELYIRMSDPFFSAFLSLDDNPAYSEYIEKYIALAKRYPDSKYLISQLSLFLNRYKKKEDVRIIYGYLSDKYKKTVWGKTIEDYLVSKFGNLFLPETLTGKEAPVIEDSTRYAIVIFSASWCRPCHEQLSLQKALYSELKDKACFTTISLDEKNTIKQWKEFVKKEKLPWKSLLAYEDIDGIRGRYYVPYVPYTVLVQPGGTFESFDLWDEKDRSDIVERIKNKFPAGKISPKAVP